MPARAAWCRFDSDSNSLLKDNTLEILNIAIASFCLALLLPVALWFGGRLLAASRAQRTWGRRRKYLLIMTATDICLQLLNLGVYRAVNVYSCKVRQW